MEKGFFRTVVTILVLVVLALVAVKFLTSLIGAIMPLLILGGVGYVIYRFMRPKSISGGRGGILP